MEDPVWKMINPLPLTGKKMKLEEFIIIKILLKIQICFLL